MVSTLATHLVSLVLAVEGHQLEGELRVEGAHQRRALLQDLGERGRWEMRRGRKYTGYTVLPLSSTMLEIINQNIYNITRKQKIIII